jgi:spermidine synthase
MSRYRVAGCSVMLPQAVPAVRPSILSRYFPALLILFAASGCAALIYEVVWYQALQLALGSTTVSMGFLLAAYMGGLCLGAAGAPRLAEMTVSPLRIYAVIELGTALLAIAVNALMPWITGLYLAGAAHGFAGMLLRGIVAGACLLPPTILMGASLPVIARTIGNDNDFSRRLGFLYGANTIGAVAGCLAAGFWLLRLYDVTVASLVAAALNTLVACVALALATRLPMVDDAAPMRPAEEPKARVARSHRAVYISIALSGAVAMGAEAVWTRLLGMLLLGTVYVFAIILAVFLTGIALGSWGASRLLDRVSAKTGLGACQLLLAPTIAWTAFAIAHILPWWRDDWLDTMNAWRMYGLDLERCLLAVLPASILFGASFPFACAAVSDRKGRTDKVAEDRPDKVAAGVYAANTLGAIAGALLVTLLFVPTLGSQRTQQFLVLLALASGLAVLGPEWLAGIPRRIAPLAGAIAVAVLCVFAIPSTPPDLIAYGRFMALNAGLSRVLYSGEGRNSSIAITQWESGAIYINVNGHVEATTEAYDMKLQRMVGHLPALLHPNPESVLGIGFGAGVSAGTFTRYPTIRHITVCEIEPLIPPASTRYFARENYEVMRNPKTRIEYDDARHFLLTTKERFDVIASDPLDVFIKGTAGLYSKEYFEAVKQRLNPGGWFSLYVPLYETSEDTIRGELATFFEAFPHGTVWANTRDGLGYDMVFLGSADPVTINLDEVEARLNRADYAPVAESLREVGFSAPFDLFSTYSGNRSDLAPWTAGADINRDSNLRLSYVAGWGINAKLNDYLYRRMLSFRHRPEGLFIGSRDKVDRLMSVLQ